MADSAADLIAAWPVGNASAAVISRNGSVRAEFGDPELVYELASVTKPLTAYAALIALQEGAFELDDPAGPDGSTVRHLLAHASGLDFDTDRIVTAPGRTRIYSNTGFRALADVISEATEIPFVDYVREAVLSPLGMTSTTIVGPSGGPGNGAHSSVADLVRFAAELQAPTLVDAGLLASATVPEYPELRGVLPGFGKQEPNPWGLGFEIRGRKSPHWTGSGNSPRTFGHFGAAGTFLWIDPDAGLACVALTDRRFDTWAAEVWPPFNDAVLTEFAQ